MKWILSLALVFLIACVPAQVAEQPAVENAEEPVPETAVKVEQVPEEEIKIIEEVDEIPEPEVIIATAVEPEPVELTCEEECENICERDARNACAENFNRDCKAKCGTIIEPITCATACSFEKRNCIPFFEKACKGLCTQYCY